MRSVNRVITIVVLAVSLVALAAGRVTAESPPSLHGHWHCSGANLPSTERSYFTLGPGSPGQHPIREIFGTADRTERSGMPSTSFEHMVELGDHSLSIESIDGSGFTPPNAAFPLRFSGRSTDGAATFTLMYELDGAALHRIAMRGNVVVDDERCTRESEPAPTACPRPNAPATLIKAVEPSYPAAAVPKRAKGTVQVRVVLDDRSRVLWADIQSSPDPVFNDSARLSARDSTYRTEVRDCRPQAAVYIFSVDYGY